MCYKRVIIPDSPADLFHSEGRNQETESALLCPAWGPVRGVDGVWAETIEAQCLDTDVDGDAQVDVLQNALETHKEGTLNACTL